MNLRAKSPAWQWGMWSIAALVSVAVYIVCTRLFVGCSPCDILGEEQQRVLIPILVALGVFAYESRWSGAVQEDEGMVPAKAADVSHEDGRSGETAAPAPEMTGECMTRREQAVPCVPTEAPVPIPAPCALQQPVPVVIKMEDTPSGTGEMEYVLARRIPHQMVPDYSQDTDCKYLSLLGRSAACGYPKALAKLGEYAVRREAWVEAYYWTWRARHAGMEGLAPVLKSIRLSWVTEGYPDECENVHQLFTEEDGSVGRALLNIESGRELAQARAYLQANRPEFLS